MRKVKPSKRTVMSFIDNLVIQEILSIVRDEERLNFVRTMEALPVYKSKLKENKNGDDRRMQY